jgi:hypothetical protein
VIASVLLAAATMPPTGGPYLLRYRWVHGQTYTYKVTITKRDPFSGDETLTGTERYDILSVGDPEILANVTFTLANGNTSMNEVKIGTHGQIFGEVETPVSWLRLPQDPVRNGDKYVAFDRRVYTPFGEAEMTNVCIFRDIVELVHRPIARIAYRTTIKGPDFTGFGSGYASFDTEGGRLISSTWNLFFNLDRNGKRESVPVRIEVRPA